MNYEEFEAKFLELVFNTTLTLNPPTIAYRLKIPVRDAEKFLKEALSRNVCALDSDEEGNLFYYVPGAKRTPERAKVAPTYQAKSDPRVMSPTLPRQQPTVTYIPESQPTFLLRALYFIFVGWWLSALVLTVGWALLFTGILAPFGILLLNRVPELVTFKIPQRDQVAVLQGGQYTVFSQPKPQVPFLLRLLYFVCIGWWAGFIWLWIAWFCTVTLILSPIGFLMFEISSKVLTLRQ